MKTVRRLLEDILKRLKYRNLQAKDILRKLQMEGNIRKDRKVQKGGVFIRFMGRSDILLYSLGSFYSYYCASKAQEYAAKAVTFAKEGQIRKETVTTVTKKLIIVLQKFIICVKGTANVFSHVTKIYKAACRQRMS